MDVSGQFGSTEDFSNTISHGRRAMREIKHLLWSDRIMMKTGTSIYKS
jgi:hypothetical protein